MQDNSTKSNLNVWLPFLFSIIMLGGMYVGGKIQGPAQTATIVFENDTKVSQSIGQGRVEELIRYIEAKYVDNVKSNELVEKAITALFEDLDPHSVYMSAKQVKKANEQLEGSFVGIGIEYLMLGDTVTVVSVIKDGPAYIAGIKPGDRIIEVFDENIDADKKETLKLVKQLRGKVNTELELTIKRGQQDKLIKTTIKRNRIIVSSVDIHYMLNEETGYIKLNKFSANTFNDFMASLKELVDEHGMKNLVFDLRQNGGGYLHEAIKILNQLFPEKDQQLVYTIGKNVKREDFLSAGRNIYDIDKIFVLIDENSASASEIVAGAIQDWDLGLIIGRRSFGKGLVQEQYDLKDGSALRLTVARYYTPAGRLIQRDYEEKGDYNNYIEDRIESGELTNQDQIQVPDTSKFYTANGREVFAGGGITPDIYIPYDSLLFDSTYVNMMNNVSAFSFKYAEQNSIALNQNDYTDTFEVTDNTLLEFGLDQGYDAIQIESMNLTCRESLKNTIKARVGRQLFGEETFYTILNNEDHVIREALDAQKSYKVLTHRKQ